MKLWNGEKIEEIPSGWKVWVKKRDPVERQKLWISTNPLHFLKTPNMTNFKSWIVLDLVCSSSPRSVVGPVVYNGERGCAPLNSYYQPLHTKWDHTKTTRRQLHTKWDHTKTTLKTTSNQSETTLRQLHTIVRPQKELCTTVSDTTLPHYS